MRVIPAAEIQPVIPGAAIKAIAAEYVTAAKQRVIAIAAEQGIDVAVKAGFDTVIARTTFEPLLLIAANQRVVTFPAIERLASTRTSTQRIIAILAKKLLENAIAAKDAVCAIAAAEFLKTARRARQRIIAILSSGALSIIAIKYLITASAGEQTIGAIPAIKPRRELTIDAAANNAVVSILTGQSKAGTISSATPKAVIAHAAQKRLIVAGTGYQRISAAID